VGRQWEQRVEVMRDTIIYFRNSPSILFGKRQHRGHRRAHAANGGPAQQFDSDGGRVMGARGNDKSS